MLQMESEKHLKIYIQMAKKVVCVLNFIWQKKKLQKSMSLLLSKFVKKLKL